MHQTEALLSTLDTSGFEPELEFRSISALEDLPSAPPWLWQGYLAEGWVTLLTGDAFAGKSTLIAGLLAALERDDSFLGLETKRATAIWVSEEDDYGLADKARNFGLERCAILNRGRLAGLSLERVVEQAARYADRHDHKLLVFDSFAGLARLEGEEENHAGAVTAKLRLLREYAAGLGLAVLFTHHTPKNGKGPRGSGAFRAEADVAIEFASEGKSSRFTLTAESRDSDPPALRAKLIKDDNGWSFMGLAVAGPESRTKCSVKRSQLDTGSILWDALAVGIENGKSYKQLVELTGFSEEQVESRLRSWWEAGKEGLGRDASPAGKPARGRPLRWYRTTGVK